MTITNTSRSAGPYYGNGVTASFPFSFKIFKPDDLVVASQTVGVSVETILILDSDYTLTLNDDQNATPGGVIVVAIPPGTGTSLVLTSDVELTQTLDLTNSGGFYPGVINTALDRIVVMIQQIAEATKRTLRFPISDVGMSGELPPASGRANKLLAFDQDGKITVAIPSSQSATDLILALLSSAGSASIGFIQSGAGAVSRLLQAKLRDSVHVRDFGGTWDGVANDAVAWQAAIDSGHRTIDARGVTSAILSQVNLKSNQSILLAGAKIVTAGTALKMFHMEDTVDTNLIGPALIVGDAASNPGTSVTATGISIVNCSKFRISDLTIRNIKGWGIRHSGGSVIRGEHGSVSGCRIEGCVWGWEDEPGAEYTTVLDLHAVSNYEANIISAAGNVSFIGGHCVDGVKDGFRLKGGSNHAHGLVSGMNINHNVRYNLFASLVTNGQTFTGCHFYGSGSSTGAIYLDRCKGIVLDGGHLDCWVYNDKGGSSGQNIIRNMYCPGSYGDIVLAPGAALGSDQIWFDGCYGAGAYQSGLTINDCAPVYLLARRGPGVYQSVSSASNLIFPTEIIDRRLAYNDATGIFTTPAGQSGVYRISGNVLISGTAMSVTNSFIDLKVGATSINLFLPTIFGTTRLAFVIAAEFQLNAGDTMALNATINGTSPQFGDGTWVSQLSVERIA